MACKNGVVPSHPSSQRSQTARPGVFSPKCVLISFASCAVAAALIGWLIPLALGTSWPKVGAALSSAPMTWVLILVAVAVIALGLDSVGFRAAFRGLAAKPALLMNAAAQAISLALPLGGALSIGFVMDALRREGLRARSITAGAALAAAADVGSLLLVPALGAGILALSGSALDLAWRLALGALAVMCLAVAMTAFNVAARPGVFVPLVKRADDTLAAFREGYGSAHASFAGSTVEVHAEALDRLRSHGAAILGAPIAARLLQALAFAAFCAWGLHVPLPFLALFAVFACARLLTLLPLTPSGIGVVDAGVAWMLVQLGAPASVGLSATLLMTLTQTLTPALLGAAALPFLRARRVSA